jgi:hypothetical protein
MKVTDVGVEGSTPCDSGGQADDLGGSCSETVPARSGELLPVIEQPG